MRKKVLMIFLAAATLIFILLASGCSGKVNMVTGCWQFMSTGDEAGDNQQQSGLPFTMYYDVYPDGHVSLLMGGQEMTYGKYTMDRDTFTFKSDDGTEKYSGSFSVNMNATDSDTGESAITMTLILDDQPVSVLLEKKMDYASMIKYLKSQTPAPTAAPPAATAAPAASPEAPPASPAPTAS